MEFFEETMQRALLYCVELCTLRPGVLLTSAIFGFLWMDFDKLCVFWRVHSIFEQHRFQGHFWRNNVESNNFIVLNSELLDLVFYRHRRLFSFPWTDFDRLCVFWRIYSMTKNIYLYIISEKHRFQGNIWRNNVESAIFIVLNCALLDPAFSRRRRFIRFLWTDFDKLCVNSMLIPWLKISALISYLKNRLWDFYQTLFIALFSLDWTVHF